MEVALPYGTQTRIVTVPNDAVVVRSQPLPALVDAYQAFNAAIAHPIGTPALVDLINPTAVRRRVERCGMLEA